MVPTDAFLQAVSRAPTVTLEELQQESMRAKRKWATRVSALNEELEAFRRELELMAAEKRKVEATLEAMRTEVEAQTLVKEKTARTLSKAIFERSQLEGEVIREETLVSELKRKLRELEKERERTKSEVHSEGVEQVRRRLDEEKQEKTRLEAELKKLTREIFDLKATIEQGVVLRQQRLNQLRHLVDCLIRGSGNSTPLAVPAKGKWMEQDVARSVRWYGLQAEGFQGIPGDFASRTPESAAVQRMLATAVQDAELSETQKWRLVDGAFSAYWLRADKRQGEQHQWVALDEDFLKAICEVAGLPEEKTVRTLSEARSDKGKELLTRNTNEAVSRGFFGSPTMVFYADALGMASEENSFVVFGSDRFEQTAFLLNKTWLGPLPRPQAKAGMSACKL